MSHIPLKKYLTALLREKDLRDQQRYDAQTKAVDAALRAQQEAVAAALAAAEKAVAKAELAAERRFESVNEFRAQLSDQAATFMPRGEAEARLNVLSDKIDELKDGAAKTTGQNTGKSASWVYLVQFMGLISGLVIVYVALKK